VLVNIPDYDKCLGEVRNEKINYSFLVSVFSHGASALAAYCHPRTVVVGALETTTECGRKQRK